VGFIAAVMLLATFLFQRFDYSALAGVQSPAGKFIMNRLARFLLNDAACVLLIIAMFNKKKYLYISFLLFLIELFVLLPLYFGLKLMLEGDSEISSPLLSQMHRMIVNPLLMFVLIMALFYQDNIQRLNLK
jgi:exosortase F-associated protein